MNINENLNYSWKRPVDTHYILSYRCEKLRFPVPGSKQQSKDVLVSQAKAAETMRGCWCNDGLSLASAIK